MVYTIQTEGRKKGLPYAPVVQSYCSGLTRGSEKKAYLTHQSCNLIAAVWAIQVGRGVTFYKSVEVKEYLAKVNVPFTHSACPPPPPPPAPSPHPHPPPHPPPPPPPPPNNTTTTTKHPLPPSPPVSGLARGASEIAGAEGLCCHECAYVPPQPRSLGIETSG